MTTGRSLARNAMLNLGGQVLPLLVALVALPPLVAGLDRARFGVLTLAWAAIGYFAVFDLGLGRALTHAVAARAASGRGDELPAVVWTTLASMLALGVAGAATMAAVSPWLVHRVLDVPPSLRTEAVQAIRLLAVAVPFVVTTAGMRGLLEAHQRFGLVNALRLPLALLTYLGPLVVLPFSRALVPIVAVLVAGRALAWLVHLVACLREYPELRQGSGVRRDLVLPLLRLGGWMTVSNVVSPLMVYLDRFIIGAALSVAAVTYYVTPYEVVTKLWLVPAALLGVLFPAFAASSVNDAGGAAQLLDRGARVLLLAMYPPVAVLVAAAPQALTLWIGPEFARESSAVLQWLAIGVFVNSVGQVPYTALQGVGRPDLTAKLHLVELPIYVATMWWLARTLGITGVAMAWTLRVTLDTALLFVFAARHVGAGRAPRGVIVGLSMSSLSLLALLVMRAPAHRAAVLGILLVAFVVLGWRRLLEPEERAPLLAALRAPAASRIS